MRDARSIALEIVEREGGFVDDPADPGGATNRGVTIGTLRRLGLDLDGDGDVDVADLRRLSVDQAADVFLRHYYVAPRIDRLPEALRASVFDMQVNAGSQAVRILQRLLGAFGEPVAVDGAIGPMTLGAAARVAQAAPSHLADAYAIARRDYYYGLADARPPLRKFARRRDGGKGGWIARAEAFMSPRFHLTAAQHRARVASWA